MTSEVATPAPTAVIEVPIETKTIVINPPADGTIIPAVTTNGNGTTATTTTTTEVETAAVGEKPEDVKVVDPRENPIEWISSLIPAGVHKVNHQILQWIQNVTFDKEEDKQPLPGKNDSVTKNQFMNFLKDGTLLAKFANTLSPGSIEKVFDGEEAKPKENQVANIQNFINFVKEKAGFTETEAFEVEDLQDKGKSGYKAVFNTLFQLGLKAQEQFSASGINVDTIVEAASAAAKNSIIQTVMNFFKRARPQLKSNKAETSVTDDNKTPISNGTNGNGVITEEVTTTTTSIPVTTMTNGDATKLVSDDIPPPVPVTAAPIISAQ